MHPFDDPSAQDESAPRAPVKTIAPQLVIGCADSPGMRQFMARKDKSVLCVDACADLVQSARLLYPDGDFLHTPNWHLPNAQFDKIFFRAPLTREIASTQLFDRLRAHLRPKAQIQLECIVFPDLSAKVWRPLTASPELSEAPTFRLLADDILSSFSVREAKGHTISEDCTAARFMFLCTPLQPTIIVIGGEPMRGKTTLARLLTRDASHAIHTDFWLQDLQARAHERTNLFATYVAATLQQRRIDTFTTQMIADNKIDDFCDALLCTINPAEPLHIVEGYAFAFPEIRDAFHRAGTANGFRMSFMMV